MPCRSLPLLPGPLWSVRQGYEAVAGWMPSQQGREAETPSVWATARPLPAAHEGHARCDGMERLGRGRSVVWTRCRQQRRDGVLSNAWLRRESGRIKHSSAPEKTGPSEATSVISRISPRDDQFQVWITICRPEHASHRRSREGHGTQCWRRAGREICPV